MSGASYQAWARFDVEKELERVDEQAQREEQERARQQQSRAKERVENSVAQSAQQSADILAAQAAVAALKAKRKGRGARRSAGTVGNDSKQSNASDKSALATCASGTVDDRAAQLQAHAELFSKKHKLLQQIMESRRRGDVLLQGKEVTLDWKAARQSFQEALAATKALEELAPQLLKAEEEQAQLLPADRRADPAEASNQQESSTGGGANTPSTEECKHDHQHSHACNHSDNQKKVRVVQKPSETLPKTNDLKAIVAMFYKDASMGVGSCDLAEGRLAAASEAFKDVLLRDDVYLDAWMMRGQAFERMRAPLLAMLHFNRVTNLDSDHEDAKEALERVKTDLLASGDTKSGASAIKAEVAASTEGEELGKILDRIQLVFQEANVLAVEGFFDYSTTKYQVVLDCLDTLRAHAELYTDTKQKVCSVIRELEVSCHLNIASGCHEMQRHYPKALKHCEQVLALDGNNVVGHFRMGQLYHALHSYSKALDHLTTAKALLSADANAHPSERQAQVFATVSKEIDKCEFDRGQYDLGYLRSLRASQVSQTVKTDV